LTRKEIIDSGKVSFDWCDARFPCGKNTSFGGFRGVFRVKNKKESPKRETFLKVFPAQSERETTFFQKKYEKGLAFF